MTPAHIVTSVTGKTYRALENPIFYKVAEKKKKTATTFAPEDDIILFQGYFLCKHP